MQIVSGRPLDLEVEMSVSSGSQSLFGGALAVFFVFCFFFNCVFFSVLDGGNFNPVGVR